MPTSNKIVVTNVAALRLKYGAGHTGVLSAVRALATADAGRGLTTTLVDISSAADMKRFKGKRVVRVDDERKTKAAIDAIFRAARPDYLVILGAPDVVCQQTLDNPAPTGPDDDPDAAVPSDLPYACDVRYATDPARFLAPTRVVGRIPDQIAATDPAFLLKVLNVAANARGGPAAGYSTYLGVSASVWQASTALSLRSVFGNDSSLQLSPPKGPSWPAALLGRLSHFINCHGADADPNFYGQKGNQYPVAFDASKLPAAGLARVLVAAECCYGAEMYDPALSGGHINVASSYLRAGAYAFFGSSTVAYGPATGNGSADLICQYFFRSVMGGASTGRAALEARQRFIQQASPLDPYDLKTAVQFLLLGDPSIEPIAPSTPKALADVVAPAQARALRRQKLAELGAAIGATANPARRIRAARPPRKILEALRAGLGAGAPRPKVVTYVAAARRPALSAGMKAFGAPAAEQRIHVAVRRHPQPKGKPLRLTVAVATEVNGAVAKIRRLESR